MPPNPKIIIFRTFMVFGWSTFGNSSVFWIKVCLRFTEFQVVLMTWTLWNLLLAVGSNGPKKTKKCVYVFLGYAFFV